MLGNFNRLFASALRTYGGGLFQLGRTEIHDGRTPWRESAKRVWPDVRRGGSSLATSRERRLWQFRSERENRVRYSGDSKQTVLKNIKIGL